MPREYDSPPADGMRFLAAEVAKKNKVKVVFPAQNDTAFMWQALGIHPMQALENIHQRMVNEAGRQEDDPDKRMKVERDMLSAFFPFGAGSPAFIPTEMLGSKNPADDLFTDRLRAAKKVLGTVGNACREHRNDTETDNMFRQCKLAIRDEALPKLQAIVDEYNRLRGVYTVPIAKVPTLLEAKRLLYHQKVLEATTWAELGNQVRTYLRPLSQVLQQMLTGLCSIQTFHVIGTFYLYRLLVRFRIEADDKVGDGTKRDVSGDLTSRMNDAEAWVIDWLKEKMRTIDKALQGAFDDVHFHLKGGRALEYLKRRPQDGRNDWDTSVLMDPHKPTVEWYHQLSQIHNLLIRELSAYKMEFFILAHLHADADVFTKELPKAPDPVTEEGSDDEEEAWRWLLNVANAFEENDAGEWPLFHKEQAGCKAELIDIGIPRRDTVGALEHWHRTVKRIIRRSWTDQVPIPSHLYYIDEYIMMIRDAFHSPMAKAVKRIRRLYSILDLSETVDNDSQVNMARELAPITKAIGGPIIPIIYKNFVTKESIPQPIRRMLTVQMHQFISAYHLRYDGALARAFDAFFNDEAAKIDQVDGTYPDGLKKDIAKAKKEDSYDDDTHGVMLRWIGFADAISAKMEKHFRDRALFFGFGWGTDVKSFAKTRRRVLGGFVKALYTAGVFKQEDELEVQFAVGGNFAAFLHADYAMPRMPQDLQSQLKTALDPVTTIDINLYTHQPMNPADVLKVLLLPALQAYQSNPDTPNLRFTPVEVADDPHDPSNKKTHPEIFIHWPDAVRMGDLTYCPIVARIRVVPNQWPGLAFVWGFPVLSLPDLIKDYRHATFEAEEFGATARLKTTTALLTALHTTETGDTSKLPTRATGTATTKKPPPSTPPDEYDPSMDTESGVSDGYGEFVVLINRDSDQLETLPYDTYKDIYRTILYKKSPFYCLKVDNIADKDEMHRLASNRGKDIDEAVKAQSENYRTAFIPRTLYELIFINKIMSEEIAIDNYDDWEIKPMTQYSSVCVDPRVNLDEENIQLSHKMNDLIIEKIQDILPDDETPDFPLTEEQLSQLLENELKILSDNIGLLGGTPPKSKYPLQRPELHRTDQHSLGMTLQNKFNDKIAALKGIIEKAHKAEIQSTGKFMLYRGTGHDRDSLEGSGGFPISYNTGLFAGAVYDHDGNTFTPLFILEAGKGYCLAIPYEDMIDRKFPFHIPVGNALKQLFGHDQPYHAWTKTTQSVVDDNINPDDIAGSHYEYNVYYVNDLTVLNRNFQVYIDNKIALYP